MRLFETARGKTKLDDKLGVAHLEDQVGVLVLRLWSGPDLTVADI